MPQKEDSRELRELFWTALGRFLNRNQSVRGPWIQWMNYKTEIRHLFFRLKADHRRASVCIELRMPDPEIRELFMDQFRELKLFFENTTGENWCWNDDAKDKEGNSYAEICHSIEGVNVYLKEDWQRMFEYFERILVALDEFWDLSLDNFKELDN